MTRRLASLVPEELDDDQRELYEAIVGGKRGTGRQLFALIGQDGALNGPFGVMLYAPSVGLPLQELGSAIRYKTSLTDRAREVAILLTATATRSEFERYAHERVGSAVGLSDQELADLRQGRFCSEDPTERAVAQLSMRAEQLLHFPTVAMKAASGE